MASSSKLLVVALGLGLLGVAHSANLLQNPSVTSNINGWGSLGSGGSVTHNATRGSPAAGSIEINLSGNMDQTLGATQCVNLVPGGNANFGARARQGALSGSAGIFVIVRFFAGSGCTSTILGTQVASPGATVPGVPAGQDFVQHSGTVAIPMTAVSAQLITNLQINTDGSSIQAWFDEMTIDANATLFANGFE